MERRDALQRISGGTALLGAAWLQREQPFGARLRAQDTPQALQGLPAVRITDVRTILTAPNGIRLVIVKVLTSEPGLYGLGCATFTQRADVVHTAVDRFLKPFLIGRNADEIEDIWQSSYVSSYWRNGPVLFNAMSGIDMALWDIKGKRANMPLYQLLGGKCRFGVDCYYHASGRDFQEVTDRVQKAMAQGYKHVRVQVAVPGLAAYGAAKPQNLTGAPSDAIGPTAPRATWEPGPYVRMVPKLFEHVRKAAGDEVELLHDIHERIELPQAVTLCKALEPYHPFFIEDPVPPEQNDHFRLLRQQTTVPLAMGELFNTRHEYVPLVANRLIDFVRMHLSQIGGLSEARKVQALCEFFGVRTAWHGPGDASPVAHAAQLALELASYNFGVHEGSTFPDETRAVFPGCPEWKEGYMYATEAPGLGIDIDEKLAAKFPLPTDQSFDHTWGETRRRDGTVIRP